MSNRQPIAFSFSGGKDSAIALRTLREDSVYAEYDVVELITTVADKFNRISHHGVRAELLVMQAEALGLPLNRIDLPVETELGCSNETYERIMDDAMQDCASRGIKTIAFGDLYLEDVRAYRERHLTKLDMQAVFPIWGCDTRALIEQFIDDGFRAIVTCVVTEKLDGSFAGRWIDRDFVADLPPEVDPCGENGEFHSFVVDGPGFVRSVPVRLGERVLRGDRMFADVLPDAVEVKA